MPNRPPSRAAAVRRSSPAAGPPDASDAPDAPVETPPAAGADVPQPPAAMSAEPAAEPAAESPGASAPAAPTQPGYRGLRVWQKSLELAGAVFALTEFFPTSARESLAVPLRRASAAIPAAIAEGNVRHTPREYTHYLSQAIGTVAEVETLLFLSVRLGLATEAGIAPLLAHCVEMARMLRALIRSVQTPSAPIADRPTRRRAPAREPGPH